MFNNRVYIHHVHGFILLEIQFSFQLQQNFENWL